MPAYLHRVVPVSQLVAYLRSPEQSCVLLVHSNWDVSWQNSVRLGRSLNMWSEALTMHGVSRRHLSC